jgi:glycosyltransferase involved in cell wall biosynthesis
MLNTPKVTVITVVRNGAHLIEKTIESVLAQTYANIEYLVVDGASTDGTIDVIMRHESEIDRWISEPDRGISDAFNKGSLMASGEAVLYMNAGDHFLERSSLEHLVSAAPDGVALRRTVTYGDAIMVLPSSRCVYVHSDHNSVSLSPRWSLCHQSALIGMDVQRRFPYDIRLMIQMDHDFWLRCIDANVEFYAVKQPICRWLAGGLSGNPRYKVAQAIEECLIRLLNGRRPKTLGTTLSIAGTTAVAEGKHKLRELVGDRAFTLLKRAAGVATE